MYRILSLLIIVGISIVSLIIMGNKNEPVRVDVTPVIKDTTKINVVGKTSLFIGDSHTSYKYGWQDQLCRKTGMVYKNVSHGGEETKWMLSTCRKHISPKYDYCFIWGGANDMASNVVIMDAVNNIQKMVDLCNKNGVTPIVLTGFDPKLCIDVSKNGKAYRPYPSRYTKFQQMLMGSIRGSVVIKNYFVDRKDGDCIDFVCHMSSSGHKKMANGIIRSMNLYTSK